MEWKIYRRWKVFSLSFVRTNIWFWKWFSFKKNFFPISFSSFGKSIATKLFDGKNKKCEWVGNWGDKTFTFFGGYFQFPSFAQCLLPPTFHFDEKVDWDEYWTNIDWIFIFLPSQFPTNSYALNVWQAVIHICLKAFQGWQRERESGREKKVNGKLSSMKRTFCIFKHFVVNHSSDPHHFFLQCLSSKTSATIHA
jgi:hypothetical protein